MDNNENVGHEEMKTDQEGSKRPIEEVDEVSNEGVKKLKSENQTESVIDGMMPVSTNVVESNYDGKAEELKNEVKNEVKPNINYNKKKKCVLLLSYSGSGYNGMQRNPGVRTIEEDLTNALFTARAISEDASRNYGKMSFQRCARTDKGVSAARQVVSLKMVPYKELLPEINKHLEPQIRVFALKQVTRGFDCKSRCSSRTYEYLLPTFAFAPTFAHTTKGFRITDNILSELNEVLKKYVGTKNFHNFTSGKDFNEESSKRYIIKFHVAGEPFVEKDMEFLVLQVQGQSFMQHQIRKMIGLVIAKMKNYTGIDAFARSFQQPKMDIPKAPGLGLILDQVHFSSYNERFGRDGFHEPLEWSECEDKIKEFKKKFIYSQIIETEANTNSMMRWCSTLSTHSYSNVGMVERQSKKDSNNIAEGTSETEPQQKNDYESHQEEIIAEGDSTDSKTTESLSKCPPVISTETESELKSNQRETQSNINTVEETGKKASPNEENDLSNCAD